MFYLSFCVGRSKGKAGICATEMYPGKVMCIIALIQRCCYFNPQCNVTVIYQVLYTKYFNINALAYNPINNVTIICGIQPIGVVTMAMKVLHNTFNMWFHDLPDMYVKEPEIYSGALHLHICTYQVNPSCLCYNYYIKLHGFCYR